MKNKTYKKQINPTILNTKTRCNKSKDSKYNDSLLGNENIGDSYSFDEVIELI